MHVTASRYLWVETASSCIVNAVLNYGSAYLIFRGHSVVPATGHNSLLVDSIGETFIVSALSTLVPALIARSRRRSGELPELTGGRHARPGNLYLQAMLTGIVFTCVCVPLNALLIPWVFGSLVSLRGVLWFKTLSGALIGAVASLLAIRRALHEADLTPRTIAG